MCIRDRLYTDGPKTVRVEAVGPCEVTADNIKQRDDIEILSLIHILVQWLNCL